MLYLTSLELNLTSGNLAKKNFFMPDGTEHWKTWNSICFSFLDFSMFNLILHGLNLISCKTRMHYSRMRTVCCSGHLGVEGMGCLPGGCLLGSVCPGSVCPAAKGQGICPAAWGCTPLPVDRLLDTRLWKHYLSATTVADGNYQSYLMVKTPEIVDKKRL